jgi:hypothetical protein
MQIENEVEQVSLFGQDIWCGKMCPEPFPAANLSTRISGSSSRKSSGLRTTDYLFLDLRPGAGNMLGAFWELNAPSLGDAMTLNTGPAPLNAGDASTLSQILQVTVPQRYYLSKTACLGILRRARARGKELPPQLKAALEVQAGLK